MEQLSMLWKNSEISTTACEKSVTIRSYLPEDREALKSALIPLTEKHFTDEELDDCILQHPGVKPEGIFLVEIDGEVVGTATGYFNNDRESGTVHMVSVLEKVRGRKLGRILCEHVMRYLVMRGCTRIVLTTDDFRLPAIKTYLSLGFQPVQDTDEMRCRWNTVYKRLEEK